MFNSLKVGMRLALGFGVILALLQIIAGVGLDRMGGIQTNTEQIVTRQ